ncbi:hypothetical protein RDWZM_006573 [Blomia tropicalis]|uniref:Vitamin K-dependent protein C n=1 Tax=Blomia tropicalis TaxID=40697 RepID=A0A9Q0RNI8_BLOTA|nr:hypothetical protein RDWZM_006573 [Blomia tropicalis]
MANIDPCQIEVVTVIIGGDGNDTLKPEQIFMRFGTTDYKSGGQTARAKKLIMHELYNNSTVENDIALIEMVETIKINTKLVRAVPLVSANTIMKPKSKVIITGWGYTYEDEKKMSQFLREVEVEIMENDECNDIFEGEISDDMFCAGGNPQGGKDACQGDSGGPVVNSFKQLVGIVSWGIGCGRSDMPGVYTLVSSYVPWIYRKVANPNDNTTDVPKPRRPWKPKFTTPIPTRPSLPPLPVIEPVEPNQIELIDSIVQELTSNKPELDSFEEVTNSSNSTHESNLMEDETANLDNNLTPPIELEQNVECASFWCQIDWTTIGIVIIIICATIPICIFLFWLCCRKKKTSEPKEKNSKDGNQSENPKLPNDSKVIEPLLPPSVNRQSVAGLERNEFDGHGLNEIHKV